MRKALKCNACHVLLDELLPALRMERAKKRRQLNPDEFIRTTERTCGKARADYGLQMRNNKVTPVYSKHAAVSRAEGSWISNYIATTCGQIIGDYDEVLSASGRARRHYALTDPKEFFAELTESAFGTNDFYPFVRAELLHHDRESLEVVERLWREPGR